MNGTEEITLIETTNFLVIRNVCIDALRNKLMIGIIGEPGYGKTTTLEYIKNEYPNQVVYVIAQKSMSAKDFYASIYEQISGENIGLNLSIHYIIKKTIHKFNENNKNKLLIIDEAGKFSPKMLEFIHEFRDATKSTTGIIIAGPEYFHQHLKDWMLKKIVGIPEFYSRVNDWVTLDKPDFNEICQIIRSNGINKREFENRFRHTSDLREVIENIKKYHRGEERNLI